MATDPAILTQRLTEAETALHQLLTGSKAERLEYDGRGMVTYTKAEIGTLRAYILNLKIQLGQDVPPRRALGIWA